MAYTKTVWKDRVVEKPRNYTMANNADGSVTLTPAQGVITEAGTPIIAASLNNVEQGISDAHSLLVEKVSLVGYSTTNPNGSYINYWTKICDISLTGQYQEASTMFEMFGINVGTGTSRAKIFFRVKQQSAMGSTPIIDLQMMNQVNFPMSYVKAVTTINTVGQTKVELYVQNSINGYMTFNINPIYQTSLITFYSNQGFISTLPTGTQSSVGFIDDGFTGSINYGGWHRLPNGLMIQWNAVTCPAGAGGTFNFPIAFPSDCYLAMASVYDMNNFYCNVTSKNRTSISLRHNYGGGTLTLFYYVIGY